MDLELSRDFQIHCVIEILRGWKQKPDDEMNNEATETQRRMLNTDFASLQRMSFRTSELIFLQLFLLFVPCYVLLLQITAESLLFPIEAICPDEN